MAVVKLQQPFFLKLNTSHILIVKAQVIWDFEDGEDHGFTLSCQIPATPAADDPYTAGDEEVTGVGGDDQIATTPKVVLGGGAELMVWAIGNTAASWAGTRTEVVVYDLIGHKVATLVDEYQNAETYNVIWNASGFSAGVYIYQLKTNDFIDTKKMKLIK